MKSFQVTPDNDLLVSILELETVLQKFQKKEKFKNNFTKRISMILSLLFYAFGVFCVPFIALVFVAVIYIPLYLFDVGNNVYLYSFVHIDSPLLQSLLSLFILCITLVGQFFIIKYLIKFFRFIGKIYISKVADPIGIIINNILDIPWMIVRENKKILRMYTQNISNTDKILNSIYQVLDFIEKIRRYQRFSRFLFNEKYIEFLRDLLVLEFDFLGKIIHKLLKKQEFLHSTAMNEVKNLQADTQNYQEILHLQMVRLESQQGGFQKFFQKHLS